MRVASTLLPTLKMPVSKADQFNATRATTPVSDRHFELAQGELVGARIAALLRAPIDWTTIKSVVDIGGGHGVLAGELTKHAPHISATVFDLEYVMGPLFRERSSSPETCLRTHCLTQTATYSRRFF